MAQVEGVVTDCRVETRGRRQLLVRLADDSGELLLRFLNFYPSQQKPWPWASVRVRGEVRGGFFGREMVHPTFKAGGRHAAAAGADARLPHQRAAAAGLPAQGGGLSALARAPLAELLPPGCCPRPAHAARGAAVPAPPAAPGRWPRWKTAATRPGSG
jgi:ATP-dependent DNA helicase RecG